MPKVPHNIEIGTGLQNSRPYYQIPKVHNSQTSVPHLQKKTLKPKHIHHTTRRKSFLLHHANNPQTPQKRQKYTRILRKGDIKFKRKRHDLTHDSGLFHLTEKVLLIIWTHKNGYKNAIVSHLRTGKYLYMVRIWEDILSRMESYPYTSYGTPIYTV